MKIFIGQAVTGENFNKLKEESMEIINILEVLGHEVYCTLCEDDSFQEKSKKEIFKHAFDLIDKHDVFLAIVRNEKRSEGMLMEMGYCLAKNKKIILAINKKIENTYLREIADEIIEFENSEDMVSKLKDFDFNNLK